MLQVQLVVRVGIEPRISDSKFVTAKNAIKAKRPAAMDSCFNLSCISTVRGNGDCSMTLAYHARKSAILHTMYVRDTRAYQKLHALFQTACKSLHSV